MGGNKTQITGPIFSDFDFTEDDLELSSEIFRELMIVHLVNGHKFLVDKYFFLNIKDSENLFHSKISC